MADCVTNHNFTHLLKYIFGQLKVAHIPNTTYLMFSQQPSCEVIGLRESEWPKVTQPASVPKAGLELAASLSF